MVRTGKCLGLQADILSCYINQVQLKSWMFVIDGLNNAGTKQHYLLLNLILTRF